METTRMSSVSTQIMLSLLFLMLPLVVGIVLFVLARRTRIRGLWWLFVALAIWPIIAMVARQAVMVLVAARLSPSNMAEFISGINAVFALVSSVLQIAAGVVLARMPTMPPAEPLCPRCGYNLTGLEEDRCPECGTRFVCETRYLTRAA